MKEFKLCAHVTVSAYTTVMANTLEEAIAKSRYLNVSLVGSGIDESDQWIIDDADGLPSNIHEE